MLKVVFDTNVIVSALITPKGTAGSLFKFTNKFKPIVSPLLLAEIVRVLAYPKIAKKYNITPEVIQETILILKKHADIIYTEKRANLLSDPMDDHVLEIAKFSKADFLVTGDQEILQLNKIDAAKIVSPKEFVKILES